MGVSKGSGRVGLNARASCKLAMQRSGPGGGKAVNTKRCILTTTATTQQLTRVRWRLSGAFAPAPPLADPPVPLAPPVDPSACWKAGCWGAVAQPKRNALNSRASIDADSLIVVDSKRTANSSPLNFQLSNWQTSTFCGFKLQWISLQTLWRKLSASRTCGGVGGRCWS